MSLTKAERVGEMIYDLLRRNKLSQHDFTRRMTQLDQCGTSGVIGACYVTWLTLRNCKDTPQRQAFLEQNIHKLRAALLEEESLARLDSAQLTEGPAESEARNACLESLRTVQRVA